MQPGNPDPRSSGSGSNSALHKPLAAAHSHLQSSKGPILSALGRIAEDDHEVALITQRFYQAHATATAIFDPSAPIPSKPLPIGHLYMAKARLEPASAASLAPLSTYSPRSHSAPNSQPISHPSSTAFPSRQAVISVQLNSNSSLPLCRSHSASSAPSTGHPTLTLPCAMQCNCATCRQGDGPDGHALRSSYGIYGTPSAAEVHTMSTRLHADSRLQHSPTVDSVDNGYRLQHTLYQGISTDSFTAPSPPQSPPRASRLSTWAHVASRRRRTSDGSNGSVGSAGSRSGALAVALGDGAQPMSKGRRASSTPPSAALRVPDHLQTARPTVSELSGNVAMVELLRAGRQLMDDELGPREDLGVGPFDDAQHVLHDLQRQLHRVHVGAPQSPPSAAAPQLGLFATASGSAQPTAEQIQSAVELTAAARDLAMVSRSAALLPASSAASTPSPLPRHVMASSEQAPAAAGAPSPPQGAPPHAPFSTATGAAAPAAVGSHPSSSALPASAPPTAPSSLPLDAAVAPGSGPQLHAHAIYAHTHDLDAQLCAMEEQLMQFAAERAATARSVSGSRAHAVPTGVAAPNSLIQSPRSTRDRDQLQHGSDMYPAQHSLTHHTNTPDNGSTCSGGMVSDRFIFHTLVEQSGLQPPLSEGGAAQMAQGSSSRRFVQPVHLRSLSAPARRPDQQEQDVKLWEIWEAAADDGSSFISVGMHTSAPHLHDVQAADAAPLACAAPDAGVPVHTLAAACDYAAHAAALQTGTQDTFGGHDVPASGVHTVRLPPVSLPPVGPSSAAATARGPRFTVAPPFTMDAVSYPTAARPLRLAKARWPPSAASQRAAASACTLASTTSSPSPCPSLPSASPEPLATVTPSPRDSVDDSTNVATAPVASDSNVLRELDVNAGSASSSRAVDTVRWTRVGGSPNRIARGDYRVMDDDGASAPKATGQPLRKVIGRSDARSDAKRDAAHRPKGMGRRNPSADAVNELRALSSGLGQAVERLTSLLLPDGRTVSLPEATATRRVARDAKVLVLTGMDRDLRRGQMQQHGKAPQGPPSPSPWHTVPGGLSAGDRAVSDCPSASDGRVGVSLVAPRGATTAAAFGSGVGRGDPSVRASPAARIQSSTAAAALPGAASVHTSSASTAPGGGVFVSIRVPSYTDAVHQVQPPDSPPMPRSRSRARSLPVDIAQGRDTGGGHSDGQRGDEGAGRGGGNGGGGGPGGGIGVPHLHLQPKESVGEVSAAVAREQVQPHASTTHASPDRLRRSRSADSWRATMEPASAMIAHTTASRIATPQSYIHSPLRSAALAMSLTDEDPLAARTPPSSASDASPSSHVRLSVVGHAVRVLRDVEEEFAAAAAEQAAASREAFRTVRETAVLFNQHYEKAVSAVHRRLRCEVDGVRAAASAAEHRVRALAATAGAAEQTAHEALCESERLRVQLEEANSAVTVAEHRLRVQVAAADAAQAEAEAATARAITAEFRMESAMAQLQQHALQPPSATVCCGCKLVLRLVVAETGCRVSISDAESAMRERLSVMRGQTLSDVRQRAADALLSETTQREIGSHRGMHAVAAAEVLTLRNESAAYRSRAESVERSLARAEEVARVATEAQHRMAAELEVWKNAGVMRKTEADAEVAAVEASAARHLDRMQSVLRLLVQLHEDCSSSRAALMAEESTARLRCTANECDARAAVAFQDAVQLVEARMQECTADAAQQIAAKDSEMKFIVKNAEQQCAQMVARATSRWSEAEAAHDKEMEALRASHAVEIAGIKRKNEEAVSSRVKEGIRDSTLSRKAADARARALQLEVLELQREMDEKATSAVHGQDECERLRLALHTRDNIMSRGVDELVHEEAYQRRQLIDTQIGAVRSLYTAHDALRTLALAQGTAATTLASQLHSTQLELQSAKVSAEREASAAASARASEVTARAVAAAATESAAAANRQCADLRHQLHTSRASLQTSVADLSPKPCPPAVFSVLVQTDPATYPLSPFLQHIPKSVGELALSQTAHDSVLMSPSPASLRSPPMAADAEVEQLRAMVAQLMQERGTLLRRMEGLGQDPSAEGGGIVQPWLAGQGARGSASSGSGGWGGSSDSPSAQQSSTAALPAKAKLAMGTSVIHKQTNVAAAHAVALSAGVGGTSSTDVKTLCVDTTPRVEAVAVQHAPMSHVHTTTALHTSSDAPRGGAPSTVVHQTQPIVYQQTMPTGSLRIRRDQVVPDGVTVVYAAKPPSLPHGTTYTQNTSHVVSSAAHVHVASTSRMGVTAASSTGTTIVTQVNQGRLDHRLRRANAKPIVGHTNPRRSQSTSSTTSSAARPALEVVRRSLSASAPSRVCAQLHSDVVVTSSHNAPSHEPPAHVLQMPSQSSAVQPFTLRTRVHTLRTPDRSAKRQVDGDGEGEGDGLATGGTQYHAFEGTDRRDTVREAHHHHHHADGANTLGESLSAARQLFDDDPSVGAHGRTEVDDGRVGIAQLHSARPVATSMVGHASPHPDSAAHLAVCSSGAATFPDTEDFCSLNAPCGSSTPSLSSFAAPVGSPSEFDRDTLSAGGMSPRCAYRSAAADLRAAQGVLSSSPQFVGVERSTCCDDECTDAATDIACDGPDTSLRVETSAFAAHVLRDRASAAAHAVSAAHPRPRELTKAAIQEAALRDINTSDVSRRSVSAANTSHFERIHTNATATVSHVGTLGAKEPRLHNVPLVKPAARPMDRPHRQGDADVTLRDSSRNGARDAAWQSEGVVLDAQSLAAQHVHTSTHGTATATLVTVEATQCTASDRDISTALEKAGHHAQHQQQHTHALHHEHGGHLERVHTHHHKDVSKDEPELRIPYSPPVITRVRSTSGCAADAPPREEIFTCSWSETLRVQRPNGQRSTSHASVGHPAGHHEAHQPLHVHVVSHAVDVPLTPPPQQRNAKGVGANSKPPWRSVFDERGTSNLNDTSKGFGAPVDPPPAHRDSLQTSKITHRSPRSHVEDGAAWATGVAAAVTQREGTSATHSHQTTQPRPQGWRDRPAAAQRALAPRAVSADGANAAFGHVPHHHQHHQVQQHQQHQHQHQHHLQRNPLPSTVLASSQSLSHAQSQSTAPSQAPVRRSALRRTSSLGALPVAARFEDRSTHSASIDPWWDATAPSSIRGTAAAPSMALINPYQQHQHQHQHQHHPPQSGFGVAMNQGALVSHRPPPDRGVFASLQQQSHTQAPPHHHMHVQHHGQGPLQSGWSAEGRRPTGERYERNPRTGGLSQSMQVGLQTSGGRGALGGSEKPYKPSAAARRQ